jgi:hypothetical protein
MGAMNHVGRAGTGSSESAAALEELLLAIGQSVATYRVAESCSDDHRVQAAIHRMRLDHERHLQELVELWLEASRDAGMLTSGQSGAGEVRRSLATPYVPLDELQGPLADAVRGGDFSAGPMLLALRSSERELHSLYEKHVQRRYMEPLRAVLARHQREETAHVSFVEESESLRPARTERPPALRAHPWPSPVGSSPAATRETRPILRASDRDGESSRPDRRLAGTG